MTNQKTKPLIFGIFAGLIAYAMIGSFGLFMLRISWADYAIASEDKSYTSTMMIFRLSVGILAAIMAGISATKMANDEGKSAWFVGVILFCVGSYNHFLTSVWTDYPVWYHLGFVIPIIPVIGLSRHLFAKNIALFCSS
jgi:uncharacterized membrane protein YeaQ/YmgE (transglycosylase-associated protein family)